LRSVKTNALQISVLVAGAIYIIIGVAFFYSPMGVFKIFVKNVSEIWAGEVRTNELIAPMYHILRAFSAMLLTSGLMMIMPLFDPLKYRLMIWINGVLFPFLSALMLIKTGFTLVSRSEHGVNYYHKSMLVFGFIFTFVLFTCLITLIITGRDAKAGKE
jgi:hypothetical protein